MIDLLTPAAVVLVGFLALASWTDITTGKVYNVLTGPMMLAGLLIHATYGDLMFAVAGLLAAFAVHYPLWLIGVEKGGDAKLMMGIGALVGVLEMLETSFYCAVLYLPVGVAVLALRGRLGNLAGVSRWMVRRATHGDPGDRPAGTMLKTAPLIAVAAVIAWLTEWIPFFT